MAHDARIPVIFGQQPSADDMVLLEEGLEAPVLGQVQRFTRGTAGHLPGCLCCVARSPAAEALAAVFRARALGTAPYFSRLLVIATANGQRDIEAALARDALCQARFRLQNCG